MSGGPWKKSPMPCPRKSLTTAQLCFLACLWIVLPIPGENSEDILSKRSANHLNMKGWNAPLTWQQSARSTILNSLIHTLLGHLNIVSDEIFMQRIMGTNLVLGPPKKFYRRNPSGTLRDVHWYHLGDPKKVPGAPSQGFLIFLGFDKNITKIEIWLSYPHF